jgi:hypothetical protein
MNSAYSAYERVLDSTYALDDECLPWIFFRQGIGHLLSSFCVGKIVDCNVGPLFGELLADDGPEASVYVISGAFLVTRTEPFNPTESLQ